MSDDVTEEWRRDRPLEYGWDPNLYKYEHIAEVVQRRIARGQYPTGTVLSEVKLREEFDVGRGTVRLAMDLLRTRQLVITRPGKGSVVQALPPESGDVLA